MPYDLADTVRLQADSRDPGGTLTNAATVTLTITLPDGTTTSPAVTNPPAQTGQYTVDYATVQPGRHSVRWVFTGPTSAYTDAVDVREASPPMLMSLADAKAHLNLTNTTHDEELRGWVESVTAGVEHHVGVCVRRTVTEKHDVPSGGAYQLALRRTPVLQVTTMTAIREGGTSYTAAEVDVDEPTGVLERLDGGRLFGPLRITYVAGRAVVPATIRDAAKIILKHLWRTQQGPGRPGFGDGDDFAVTEQVPGFGYAVPNRALQLLEPYKLPPGVA